MKKAGICVWMVLFGVMGRPQDPITLVIKEGIKKVIIAVDLKIQRLQTKTIWLQNAQKILENDLSKLKLGEITAWVQRQKDLYQNYFDELWKVRDMISYYHRIREITLNQETLVREYHRGWTGVQKDSHFSTGEVLYIGQVYTGIIEESLKNLEQAGLVIQSFLTQMSDAKRIEIINTTADAMQKNLNDLRQFNQQNMLLSLQRARDENEITVVKSLYGVQ